MGLILLTFQKNEQGRREINEGPDTEGEVPFEEFLLFATIFLIVARHTLSSRFSTEPQLVEGWRGEQRSTSSPGDSKGPFYPPGWRSLSP